VVFVLMSLTAAILSMPASAAVATGDAAGCGDVTVPVSLSPGQPKTYTIYGRFCVPQGASPQTIQLLVHGITYDHSYWNFPDPAGGSDRYDYTAAANKAGYATLAVDRIGEGRSSHPLGALVTIESNANAMHDVVQAIRSGSVHAPSGARFSKIVYVGHSYGSWIGWYETSTFNDVDAFVITGVTHKPTPLFAPLTVVPNVVAHPALLDPQFGLSYPDLTYTTSIPGKRYDLFYAPAAADPAVVAYDEAHKGTMTDTEIATYPLILAHPLNIRVPVMLVDGSEDSLFCRPELGGADCSSPQSLIAEEAPSLGPNVPSVDAYVDPQAGHDVNLSYNSQASFAAIQNWIGAKVGD
jgi:pimeloyl-ACP methyl ester carboxylesterase